MAYFFLPVRRPPGSPLFPYTTLFRSHVGSLDSLGGGKTSPAGDGGAYEHEKETQGSHQQNGTRRMADAVFATPSHEGSSCSGHGGNRRAVLGVDRPHELPRDQALRRLVGVNTVAAERQPERE